MSRYALSVACILACVLANSGCKNTHGPPPQGRIIGTVDGQPLRYSPPDRTVAIAAFRSQHLRAPDGPADQAEVDAFLLRGQCLTITRAISGAARAAQIRRLGISWTPAEAEALRSDYLRLHDPAAALKKQQDDLAVLVVALNEVYDHGMDQRQAYEKYLAPRSYPQQNWQAMLEVERTPEARAQLVRQANIPRDTVQSPGLSSFGGMLERQRLDDAVDQAIAATDDTFRGYLQEETRAIIVKSPLETRSSGIASTHMNYLKAKRAEWWQAREAEIKVVIDDAAFAKQCGIGADGRPLPGDAR
jgi:hypothetical protein